MQQGFTGLMDKDASIAINNGKSLNVDLQLGKLSKNSSRNNK